MTDDEKNALRPISQVSSWTSCRMACSSWAGSASIQVHQRT